MEHTADFSIKPPTEAHKALRQFMKPHRSSEKVNGLLAKCQGSQNGHFFVSFLKSDLNFAHFSL